METHYERLTEESDNSAKENVWERKRKRKRTTERNHKPDKHGYQYGNR